MDNAKYRNKCNNASYIAKDEKNDTQRDTYGDASETQRRLIDLKEILSRQPYRRTSIYRKVRTGEFPAPIKIGPNRIAWLESEFEQWLEERIRLRSATDNEQHSDPEGDV